MYLSSKSLLIHKVFIILIWLINDSSKSLLIHKVFIMLSLHNLHKDLENLHKGLEHILLILVHLHFHLHHLIIEIEFRANAFKTHALNWRGVIWPD